MDLAEKLRRRESRIFRLPEPERPEEEDDLQERHSHAGADVARMAARMQGALRRLGLKEGGAVLLAPTHTLEQFVLWLAAVVGGHDVLLAATPEEGERAGRLVPNGVEAVICAPPRKAVWQEVARATGARLATLGGHWQGSFFMLQMVRPETEMSLVDAPGVTMFMDGARLALPELMERADRFAEAAGLASAPAMVLSAPVLSAPRHLVAALAALMVDAPLYWLAPEDRERALQEWPAVPEGTVLLSERDWLADLAARRGGAGLGERMRFVDIDAVDGQG